VSRGWTASDLAREGTALLMIGGASFFFLSLWAAEWTGALGRIVAAPVREVFGTSAFLLPGYGFLGAAEIWRSGRLGSVRRGGAAVALFLAIPVLLELSGLAPRRALGGVYGEFVSVVVRENFGVVGAWCFLLPVVALSAAVLAGTPLSDLARGLRAAGRGIARATQRLAPRGHSPAGDPAAKRRARLVSGAENLRRVRVEAPLPPPILLPELAARPGAARPRRPSQEPLHFGSAFRLPSLAYLEEPEARGPQVDEEALRASSLILANKLADFGVQGKVTAVRPGPVITTFEFEPAPGVKVNRIVTLADDLSMALRAMSVRILAPIPGKSVVGIEVSNPRREKVVLRELLESEEFQSSPSRLTLALGKDSVGKPVVADLARMPHLLVAGATGTGKSVSLNAMIMSILFKATPEEVRFLLIDPKMLELSLYENVPHLLTRVVTDPKEASAALARAVVEMENRYKLLRAKGVRNIDSYNRLLEAEAEERRRGVIELKEPEEEASTEGWAPAETREAETLIHRRLPYLVIVIDELADLMLTSGREVEEQITRLAQKARAAGIHLVVATQRPSVDVITGLIKANFPARISFQVTSRIDSRTILDAIGAERLLGGGDMLFLPPGTARLTRIHGAYVSEAEIRRVVGFLRDQSRPVYDEEFTRALDEAHQEKERDGLEEEEFADELYEQAVELVADSGQASISWLQRRLRVGYNRAARMIERMEREGLVSPADGVRPREVRIRRSEGER
jgi:S-DNA-T family DNA segregation ATPase FtsK/SpoIIIE